MISKFSFFTMGFLAVAAPSWACMKGIPCGSGCLPFSHDCSFEGVMDLDIGRHLTRSERFTGQNCVLGGSDTEIHLGSDLDFGLPDQGRGHAFVQILDQEPIPLWLSAQSGVDLYQSLDGRLILRVNNPSFFGTLCVSNELPLPHTSRTSICPGSWIQDGIERPFTCWQD